MSISALPVPTMTPATVTVETITPEMADAWLRYNTHNRSIRPTYVDQLAHAMSSGQWELNGQSISFSTNPTVLVDGQHRLCAVVKSGVTIQSVVVRGIDLQAQRTIDVGPGRTFADVLTWAGESSTTVLASALAALHRYRTGGWARNTASRPTFDDMLQLLADHPVIRQSVRKAEALRHGIGRSPSGPNAATHYVMWEQSHIDADVFFDRLATGADLSATDPIYMLRRILISEATAQKRMTTRHRMALTIKAWNAWITGAEMKLLKFSPGGANPESFPVILGPE